MHVSHLADNSELCNRALQAAEQDCQVTDGRLCLECASSGTCPESSRHADLLRSMHQVEMLLHSQVPVSARSTAAVSKIVLFCRQGLQSLQSLQTSIVVQADNLSVESTVIPCIRMWVCTAAKQAIAPA